MQKYIIVVVVFSVIFFCLTGVYSLLGPLGF